MLMRSALRLGFIVLGACAYTGLAILGWGGFRPFFSHPALTALVAVLFALSILSFFAGGNVNAGVREDRGNRWVIAVFVIIGSTPICRHTRIVKGCGRSTAIRFAG